MSLLHSLTVLLLLGGGGWALSLAFRGRDPWGRGLAVGIAVLAGAHTYLLLSAASGWQIRGWGPATDLADVGVGVALLLSVSILARLISKHEVLEGRLGRKEAYLESLFDSSSDAIVFIDAEGRILQANPSFMELFGLSLSAVEGGVVSELVALPDRREEFRELSRKVVAGEKLAIRTLGTRPDGGLLDLSVLGGPLRLASGQAAAFLLIRDITELVRLAGKTLRFEQTLDTMQLGVTITDLTGTIIYTNAADAELHGYTQEELLGQDVRIFAPQGTAKPLSPKKIESMRRWARDTRNRKKGGGLFPVRLLSDVLRDEDGRPVGVVTTCEDITRRKRAEQALKESEERYALAMRGAKDGLWDWNLNTGEVYYSARWKSMLGFEDVELGSTAEAWLDRVHPGDLLELKAQISDHREDRAREIHHEHRIRRKDGEYRWVLVRGIAERDPQGAPYRIVGSMSDISARKDLEENLARDALYDHLTRLPNRAFFNDLLHRTFAQAGRHENDTFALLYLDLDRFKVVNDSLGHAAGDQLLIEVARRLESSIRPGDVAARLGGDEFCVLLSEIHDSSDATRVARRIQEAMEPPVILDGREVFTSASIGIAVYEEGVTEEEHLLRHADSALYRAKSRGKSRFEIFDEEMHSRALALLQLETDIRDAVENGQFRAVYQPVVRLEDQTVTGVEALLRWQHPKRGLVPNHEFMPLALETGLIVPIGNWMIEEACRQMATWARQFSNLSELKVSVNLAWKQLRQPKLVELVERALTKAQLAPDRLLLEVSEEDLMMDADRNIETIQRLKEMGVRVQIDDFGTGSSSLTYLNRFEVDTLKIDRSFVSSLGMTNDRAAVVQAMITLARDMGIQVIAEGIETVEQSDQLKSYHCDRGQGYLFSRPLEASDTEKFLQSRLKA